MSSPAGDAHISSSATGADTADNAQLGPAATTELVELPVHVVVRGDELPASFLEPSASNPLVIGFDCEGVSLSRHGQLCLMQLSFRDAIYLVDVVTGGPQLMQLCKPGLESLHVIKVVHDCKRDAEALFFQFGIKLHAVFDTQVAFAFLEELSGHCPRGSNGSISFVQLMADPRYCGVAYEDKKDIQHIIRKEDVSFWLHRPLTPLMTKAASDDVRFLRSIYGCMMRQLARSKAPGTLRRLAYRTCLHCRCFCVSPTPSSSSSSTTNCDPFVSLGLPSYFPLEEEEELEPSAGECEEMEGQVEKKEEVEEEDVVRMVDVPPGKMGRVIGRQGVTIKAVQQSCRADIILDRNRGPQDRVFVIGPPKEANKAAAIVRGSMM